MKKSFFITAVFTALIASMKASGITVDVYQGMQHGSNEEVLTADTANASSYGAVNKDSTARWIVTDSLFIDDSFLVAVPGQILVNGVNRNVSPVHTWRWRNRYELNYIHCYWDTNGHTYPYYPLHAKITIGFYYRTNQPGQVSNQHDNCTIGLWPAGWATLQLVGISGRGNNCYIRAHADTLLPPSGTKSTFSDTIRIDTSKTYWINLHHDADSAKCFAAVFDPETWHQVGSTVWAYSRPNKAMSRAKFGRCSAHGNSPNNESATWISHIMIDFTQGKFPLLPDTGSALHTRYEHSNEVHTDAPAVRVSAGTGQIEVRYDGKTPGPTSMALYGVTGKKVASIPARYDQAGLQVIRITAAGAPSGVYYLSIRRGGIVHLQKIILKK
jgi:hypothetical protein